MILLWAYSSMPTHKSIDAVLWKCYSIDMERTVTAKYKITDRRNDDFVPGTPEERIALVWVLTREIASLNKKYDVERRLQRHVTRLVRREG